MINKTNQAKNKIAFFSPNWLGDCVMSLPLLVAIKQSNPSSEIEIICKKSVVNFWEILLTNNSVANIHILKPSLKEMLLTIFKLNKMNFKEAYFLPRTIRTFIIATFLCILKKRLFKSAFGSWLFSSKFICDDLNFRDQEHQSKTYLRLLSSQSITQINYIESFYTTLDFINSGNLFTALNISSDSFSLPTNYYVLIPGAARGPSKRWPTEHFAQFILPMREKFPALAPIIIGTASENILAEEIIKLVQDKINYNLNTQSLPSEDISPKIINLVGQTNLFQLGSIAIKSKFLICNDSGGMHFTSVLNANVIAIFGETNSNISGPLGKNSIVIQKSQKRSRKIAKNSPSAIEAMASVTVEDVYM